MLVRPTVGSQGVARDHRIGKVIDRVSRSLR